MNVSGIHRSAANREFVECPLSAVSSRSQIRRHTVLHQNSYDRFRLEAAGQIIELRQAENDPKRTFVNGRKQTMDGYFRSAAIVGGGRTED